MSEPIRGDVCEERWRGLSVSEGLVIGQVVKLQSASQLVYSARIADSDIERETRRLRGAVRLARRQLRAIKKRAEKKIGAEHAHIFDAHLLLMEDRILLEDVESYIRLRKANAEWAVKVAADRILAIYSEIKDDYLRQRASDIEDVCRRILAALSGEKNTYSNLTEDAVIVAEDLLPSLVAELNFQHAKAIVTDAGGWTSHSSIIARGLGIPAIVGLREFYKRVTTGDTIVVDAIEGDVYLNPTEETLSRYRDAMRARTIISSVVSADSDGTVKTVDGVEISLYANVEHAAEFEGVRKSGAKGVGLYRTEFLLAESGTIPGEDEQRDAYVEVGRMCGTEGATIRLFDLGGDKVGVAQPDTERNPALGLRAIRFCLRNEDFLRTQLRAILRAAAEVKLNLVLPLVADVGDLRRTKLILEEERAELVEKGTACGEIRIGAMIEVPSAVMTIASIAAEVDFLSLGTNDLVQYLLAADRGNENVAEWFRSLHPAVLRSIRMVVEAAKRESIPLVVCGEMAGTPIYALVLIGLGIRELSMVASSIPLMRRILPQISFSGAAEIGTAISRCVTANESEELLRFEVAERWPGVFPELKGI